MTEVKKPVVLTFINNYLPGYKAGGIPRSMNNAVENLINIVEFKIVTRDRDLGDREPYRNIRKNEWQRAGSADVYYLSPAESSVRKIRELILADDYDVLYLNSFFDSFTIKALLIRYFDRTFSKPVILAPRGEFAEAALSLKFAKKYAYILLGRVTGLYKNLTWHASSGFEEADIMRVMKIKREKIHIALDLPVKFVKDNYYLSSLQHSADGIFKIIFISRIARVKNLDYAIQILGKLKAAVLFDIYGPLEDMKYWNECRMLIGKLPVNITVRYKGIVLPDQVVQIFSGYDLFLFPTGGENFGHVIAECLISGTPVLTSDKTPWRNLRDNELGWDIPLDQIGSWAEVIEKCALMSSEVRLQNRVRIRNYMEENLLDPGVIESHRQLFAKQIAAGQEQVS
jgi:glycosyltransferase involved in cell wall biosynthesis